MKASGIIILFCVTSLYGCSMLDSQKDKQAALLNPTKIHVANDAKSDAYQAGLIPIEQYYQALNLAKTRYTVQKESDGKESVIGMTQRPPNVIVNYLNEGIGLVDAYCLRWFQRLDDMSRLLAFQNKSVNVISQLGTTLLGIGSAGTNWVTGYGAVNTAYAGLSENFNGSFLVAPNSSKVKDHIQSAMKIEAQNIRSSSSTMSFAEAYNALERYADLCTYDRAKQIVDTSLDLTKSNVDVSTGQLITEKKP